MKTEKEIIKELKAEIERLKLVLARSCEAIEETHDLALADYFREEGGIKK
jgi:hypothetical protein